MCGIFLLYYPSTVSQSKQWSSTVKEDFLLFLSEEGPGGLICCVSRLQTRMELGSRNERTAQTSPLKLFTSFLKLSKLNNSSYSQHVRCGGCHLSWIASNDDPIQPHNQHPPQPSLVDCVSFLSSPLALCSLCACESVQIITFFYLFHFIQWKLFPSRKGVTPAHRPGLPRTVGAQWRWWCNMAAGAPPHRWAAVEGGGVRRRGEWCDAAKVLN
jgi:hypothetical protein